MFAFRRLPRVSRLVRLCAAGACLLLALTSALDARRAHASASRPVVVAARGLPAGHVLTDADLRVARWPPALVPAKAYSARSEALHQRLAGPVESGEVLSPARMLGRSLTTGLPGGTVAVAVEVSDPHAAQLVHPGDRVDLLATPRPPDVADSVPPPHITLRTVTTRALVLAVFADPDAAGQPGSEVVLGLDRTIAMTVARDRPSEVFTVVGDPP
jgi:Flp pilus assembly protein CpaB